MEHSRDFKNETSNENEKTIHIRQEQRSVHWLFCSKENLTVNHPRKNEVPLRKSAKQIADELTVRLQKESSLWSSSEWSKSIPEDPTITIFDDVSYLFTKGTIKRNLKGNLDEFNTDNRAFKESSSNGSGPNLRRIQRKIKEVFLTEKSAGGIKTKNSLLDVEIKKNKLSIIDTAPLTTKKTDFNLNNDLRSCEGNKRGLDDTGSALLEKKRKMDNALTSSTNGIVETGKRFVKAISSCMAGKKTKVAHNNSIEIEDDEEPVVSTPKIECPMCRMLFDENSINGHAFNCQGPVLTRKSSRASFQTANQNSTYNQDDWIKACADLDPRVPEVNAIPDEVLRKCLSENVWKDNSKHKKPKKFTNGIAVLPSKEISIEEKVFPKEDAKATMSSIKLKDLKSPNENFFAQLENSSLHDDTRVLSKKKTTGSYKNASRRNFDDSQNDVNELRCCKCKETFTTMAIFLDHTNECLKECV